MAEAVAILLAQFRALRNEIEARSAAQSAAVQLAVTALGALGALAFTEFGDKRLLLLIPVVATILGLIWLDHAANISNLGDFIKDRLIPSLKSEGALADLPDYEQFVRGYERNWLVIVRAFGLPPLLVFVLIPIVAMVVAFGAKTHDWIFWTLFVIDLVLLGVFILYWLPFTTQGPRPTTKKAPPGSP